MASAYSFDVTSTVDLPEVENAINQARKELAQRYDFKGSPTSIDLDAKANTLTLTAVDAFKMEALWEILATRLVRRDVPVKNLTRGEIDHASGGTVKQVVTLQQNISSDAAREGLRHRASVWELSLVAGQVVLGLVLSGFFQEDCQTAPVRNILGATMMHRHVVMGVAIAAVSAATFAACDAGAPSPMAPSAVAGLGGSANADGSTLKVSAPVALFPADGTTNVTPETSLTARAGTGLYQAVALAHRFQVSDSNTFRTILATGTGAIDSQKLLRYIITPALPSGRKVF